MRSRSLLCTVVIAGILTGCSAPDEEESSAASRDQIQATPAADEFNEVGIIEKENGQACEGVLVAYDSKLAKSSDMVLTKASCAKDAKAFYTGTGRQVLLQKNERELPPIPAARLVRHGIAEVVGSSGSLVQDVTLLRLTEPVATTPRAVGVWNGTEECTIVSHGVYVDPRDGVASVHLRRAGRVRMTKRTGEDRSSLKVDFGGSFMSGWQALLDGVLGRPEKEIEWAKGVGGDPYPHPLICDGRVVGLFAHDDFSGGATYREIPATWVSRKLVGL